MITTKIDIGTDLIEVRRFRSKPVNNANNASFYHSIFTEHELRYCMKYSDPYPHFAGIFAAKESMIKCLKKPVKMIHIEITHNRYGKPAGVVSCCNNKKKAIKAAISISHTRSLAIAMAVTGI
jgi:holo-[acyl-carrier protein] synthase